MSVFAPQLDSNIAIEQPVQQARVGSALAGLASDLLARPSGTASKPSSEERFGAAWGKFTQRLVDQGEISEGTVFTPGTASLKQLRSFGAINPEFTDDVFTRASSEKNQALVQLEAQNAGQSTLITKYYSEGHAQVAKARGDALRAIGKENEADALEAKAISDFVTRQAENASLSERAKNVTDITTVSNDAWSVNKGMFRDTADIASRGVAELLVAIKSDPTGSFDLETQGLGNIFQVFPNVTIKTVTKDNLPEFMQQIRAEIMRTHRMRLEGEVGFTLRDAPSGFESDVFRNFDVISEFASKNVEPATILKRIENNAFLEMMKLGAPTDLVAVLSPLSNDPTAITKLLGDITPDFMKAYDKFKGTTEERNAALKALSTESMVNARVHFSKMLGIYSGKDTDFSLYPEVSKDQRLMGVKDSMLGLLDSHGSIDERTGKVQRFTKEAWKQYFESNAADIIQIASTDSEFATTVGTSLVKDIMVDVQKIEEITTGKGITVSFKNGKIAFGVDKQALIADGVILSDKEAADLERRSKAGDAMARQRLLDYASESSMNEDAYIKQVVGAEQFRKTSANLDDMNYKWTVLGQLGQVGVSSRNAIQAELGGTAVAGTTASAGQEPASMTAYLIDKYEAGSGGYSTLFKQSQNSAFSGVDVSRMTLDQLYEFSNTSGAYAKYVKENNPKGKLATPMGRYQFVGTTLKEVAKQMGLSGDTVFNKETQDAMFLYYARSVMEGKSREGKRTALRNAWDGFKNASDQDLNMAIFEIEGGNPDLGGSMTGAGGAAGGAQAATATDTQTTEVSAGGGIVGGGGAVQVSGDVAPVDAQATISATPERAQTGAAPAAQAPSAEVQAALATLAGSGTAIPVFTSQADYEAAVQAGEVTSQFAVVNGKIVAVGA